MENTSRKTEREKIQKHLLISMGAFAFAKVVWAIFFMLFEPNTSVVIYGKFESEAHAAVDDEFPMQTKEIRMTCSIIFASELFSWTNFLSIISSRAWSSLVSSQVILEAFSSCRIFALCLVISMVSLSLADLLLTLNFV